MAEKLCSRAKSDMTPCVLTDGDVAFADDGHCVGCGYKPASMAELRRARFLIGADVDERPKIIPRAYLKTLIEAVQVAPRPREADQRLADALDNLYAEIELLYSENRELRHKLSERRPSSTSEEA